MFIGRDDELAKLKVFKERSIAGLGVAYGRRRVSFQLKLEEMPLSDANKFWLGDDNISASEKFKTL